MSGTVSWTAKASIISYGVRIKISTNSQGLLKDSLACLTPRWEKTLTQSNDYTYYLSCNSNPTDGSTSNHSYSLQRDDLLLIQTSNKNTLLDVLKADSQLLIAENARRKIFVHAGVVGWRGQALVIPGRSFSGKSSFVKALVEAGATYYSDEYAIFNEQGWVEAFPKPLSLRRDGSIKQIDYDIKTFGGQQGVEPLPIGLIIVSRFEAEGLWSPVKISHGEAILALLNNTVSARRVPSAAMSFLARASSRATAYESVRGEAKNVAELTLKLLQ